MSGETRSEGVRGNPTVLVTVGSHDEATAARGMGSGETQRDSSGEGRGCVSDATMSEGLWRSQDVGVMWKQEVKLSDKLSVLVSDGRPWSGDHVETQTVVDWWEVRVRAFVEPQGVGVVWVPSLRVSDEKLK